MFAVELCGPEDSATSHYPRVQTFGQVQLKMGEESESAGGWDLGQKWQRQSEGKSTKGNCGTDLPFNGDDAGSVL
jgi:hypothetical protein